MCIRDSLDVISRYPDREYTALRQAIAAYAGTRPEHLLVGNGATELISLFIQNIRPKKALILGPTYSEYERAITLAGGSTAYYPLKEEQDFQMDVPDLLSCLNRELQLLVLCNPNNPTGTAITRADMEQIITACQAYHIFVLVDETYVAVSYTHLGILSPPVQIR